MKIETPQILWNSEGDKGINAALNSISMLESGLSEHTDDDIVESARCSKYGNVMVTAGNTNIINLWKLSFASTSSSTTSNDVACNSFRNPINENNNKDASNNNDNNNNNDSDGIFQKAGGATKIEYLCSLTRQENSVNTVAFSPDGLHLATGGETGAIVVWSVPPAKRGGGNGRHYWSTVEREQDLNVRIVSRSGEGVCDISWSADSKRFIAGTIDHSVLVCEDKHYDANHKFENNDTNDVDVAATASTAPVDSEWEIVYRNNCDHTQYVQGVAYDPRGVYLASMGSDRTVKIFPRKTPPKSKKKVLRTTTNDNSVCIPPPEQQQNVDQILTETKLEISKPKTIKSRYFYNSNANDDDDEDAEETNENNNDENNNNNTNMAAPSATTKSKCNLFVDEAILQSFFRRLAWTKDGAFLITPGALWRSEPNGDTSIDEKITTSPYATCLFARHNFDEPYKVLTGLEKPSVAVRPSPVLYKVPSLSCCASTPQPTTIDSKENLSPSHSSQGLPYRSVFAVLTTDSILVYDTHHTRPLSLIRGMHYAGLSDCQWSNDGMKLIVSSIDGYISIVTFERDELGEVYNPPMAVMPRNIVNSPSSPSSSEFHSPLQSMNVRTNYVMSPLLPPCEPGQSATIEAPPSKRAKKTRITPTLISSPVPLSEAKENKRSADELLDHETKTVGEAVTKLTLDNDEKPTKKKKRIAPILISTGNEA